MPVTGVVSSSVAPHAQERVFRPVLTQVAAMLRAEGFYVVNIDATVVLQKPKIAPCVEKMVSNIAFALAISEKCVNVKATTEEGLGFTGREEGACAHSVAMIAKS